MPRALLSPSMSDFNENNTIGKRWACAFEWALTRRALRWSTYIYTIYRLKRRTLTLTLASADTDLADALSRGFETSQQVQA